MRIKPKNPKVQRIRRIAVGAVALCAVLFILLRNQDTGLHLEDDESAPPPETATTAVPEGISGEGDLDWEYPEGWVDYSDLPAREDLGDEDPGDEDLGDEDFGDEDEDWDEDEDFNDDDDDDDCDDDDDDEDDEIYE